MSYYYGTVKLAQNRICDNFSFTIVTYETASQTRKKSRLGLDWIIRLMSFSHIIRVLLPRPILFHSKGEFDSCALYAKYFEIQ